MPLVSSVITGLVVGVGTAWAAPAHLAPGVDPTALALGHLRAEAPAATFAVDRSAPWAGGVRVRLRQQVHGVPVDGGVHVVSVAPDGRILRAAGEAPVGDLDVVPTVTDADAIGVAGLWVDAMRGGELAWAPYTSLVVKRDVDGVPHLAWAVHIATAAPFTSFVVWVDAHDREVLGHAVTSANARGNVYPTNPIASAVTEVDLDGLTTPDGLVGDHAYSWSCDNFTALNVCTRKSAHASPDADGNFLFDPDPTSEVDPMAEVQMYYHLDLVYRWFEDRVGFHLAAPIQGLVNFPLENAFYGDADGDGVGDVAFGQGAGIDFAYDADVIYHEFGHAVIGNVTSLGLFGADEYGVDFTPLSLNEGSADTFSTFITGDPTLGEYAGSGFGLAAIRDLGPDRKCPDDLYGEGHEDGIIWGTVGWNMADDPAIGVENALQIYYGAITSWTSDAITWSDAGQSLVDSLDDLLSAGAIDQAAHDAGIAYVTDAGLVGCERVIPLDTGIASTQFFISAGLADQVGGYIPLSAQFSLDVPADATAAVLDVSSIYATLASTPWTVFVRKGDHVLHDVENVFGLSIPVPTTYDFAIDGSDVGSVRVDAASPMPLEPGNTYYFALSTSSDGLSLFDIGFGEITIEGHVELDSGPTTPGTTPPTTPGGDDDDDVGATPTGDDDDDAAVDGEGDEKGGCGCDSTPSGAGLGLALLPLAVALRLRRRRG